MTQEQIDNIQTTIIDLQNGCDHLLPDSTPAMASDYSTCTICLKFGAFGE